MNNRFFALAEAFVTVVRSNSITLAAQELKTTKSNISQKLSDFEALLDLRLVNRTTRTMHLTPAGERVFKVCCHAVDATIKTVSELYPKYDVMTRPAGKIILSGSNIYLTCLIVPIVQEFLVEYPDIKLVLIGSDRTVDFVAEDVDLGIRIGPVQSDNLMSTSLQPLQRVLCAGRDFPGVHDMPKHPRDLLSMPCILREQEKPKWHFINGNKTHDHYITDPVLSVNSIEMAHGAANNGLGFCLLARFVVNDDILSGRLSQVLPEWKVSPIPVTLLCRHSRLSKPQVNLFHKYLIAKLGSSESKVFPSVSPYFPIVSNEGQRRD